MNLKSIVTVLATVASFAGGSFFANAALAPVTPGMAQDNAGPIEVVNNTPAVMAPGTFTQAPKPTIVVKATVSRKMASKGIGQMFCGDAVESNLGTMVQYCEVR
jgi:hypothetical protein